MKCLRPCKQRPYSLVAPPRGERGLKLLLLLSCWLLWSAVAPPRGERGLKWLACADTPCTARGRSPSWGAWIEMRPTSRTVKSPPVAPPRGERGLKYAASYSRLSARGSRSPSWGAWIEILSKSQTRVCSSCRSPSWGAWIEMLTVRSLDMIVTLSLPLVGSVD